MKIIVKLQGGLGNQLFQYAFGVAFKLKYNALVTYDTHMYTRKESDVLTKRTLEIEKLIGGLTEVDQKKLKRYHWSLSKANLIKYWVHKLKGNLPAIIMNDLNAINFKTLSKNMYADGYWQSEKYFVEFRKELLNDLKFKISNEVHFESIYDQIKANTTTCSVHIRRGDYVTNELYNNVYLQLTKSYYDLAMNHIMKYDPDTKFIIFSDDMDWVKDNLKFENAIYCSNMNSAIEDLHLMSLCSHNIIANSTFSWWGAWLNNNKNKIVVSPKYWFNDVEKNKNDIIPNSWIKIDLNEKN